MRKLLITLVITFVIAGTNAFAMTFKTGDDTIDIYASIRAYTVFTYTSPGKEYSVCSRPADKSCSQFAIGLQDNSRAGIRWTKGNIFLNNEWGINSVDEASGQSLRLRFLYGDYKFGDGSKGRIRIGQIPGIVHTTTIYDTKLSADNGLQGYGMLSDVRRIGINYEIGGFSVSALSMYQDRARVEGLFGTTNNNPNAGFLEIMPRLEVAYKVSDFTVAGTYVKSSVRDINSSSDTYDKLYHVDAGHIMFTANPKLSDKVRLLASGFYSVNGGLYDMVTTGGGYSKSEAVNRSDWRAIPILKAESEKVEFDNTSVFGGAIGIAAGNVEAGFGIQNAKNDQWDDNNQTNMGFYANYKYRVSNFRITPEIGYLHSGNRRGTENAYTRGFRFGVQFRFDI